MRTDSREERGAVRGVAVLLTGSVAAQGIPILASFALSRLYPDTAFGLFTVFQSALTLLSTVSTGRYEAAILVPRSRRAALKLAASCMGSSAVVSGAVLATSVVAGSTIERMLDAPGFAAIAPLLAPALLLSDMTAVATRWCNRDRRWSAMASAQALGALVRATLSIAAGLVWQSAMAMVIATIAGSIAALMVTRPPIHEALSIARVPARRQAAARMLGRHRRFPLYSMPAGILEAIARESVVGVMAVAFGTATVGMLGLAQRTVRMPVQALSASMGQVFRQAAARRLAAGEGCRDLLLRTAGIQALLAAPVFGTFILLGPDLFAVLFGEPWREAGVLARALSPMCFLSFTVGTVSNVLMLAGRQRFDFVNQAWLAPCAAGAAWLTARATGDAAWTVAAYGAVYSAKYVVEFIACFMACAPRRAARP
jgi:O-antigen/teichoic acid export membrane protein